jgi:hypothetical protein
MRHLWWLIPFLAALAALWWGKAMGYRGAGDSNIWARWAHLSRYASPGGSAASASRTGARQARRRARHTPATRLTHYQTGTDAGGPRRPEGA